MGIEEATARLITHPVWPDAAKVLLLGFFLLFALWAAVKYGQERQLRVRLQQELEQERKKQRPEQPD